MPRPALPFDDMRSDRLSHIERLLDEYHSTGNRRLLRRALELWELTDAELKAFDSARRSLTH